VCQIGIHKRCHGQIGAAQVGAREPRGAQIGTPEVSTRQVCSAKIRAGQIGCLQVRARQLRAAQVCVGEAGSGEGDDPPFGPRRPVTQDRERSLDVCWRPPQIW